MTDKSSLGLTPRLRAGAFFITCQAAALVQLRGIQRKDWRSGKINWLV
jgi:hypothetical protein